MLHLRERSFSIGRDFRKAGIAGQVNISQSGIAPLLHLRQSAFCSTGRIVGQAEHGKFAAEAHLKGGGRRYVIFMLR